MSGNSIRIPEGNYTLSMERSETKGAWAWEIKDGFGNPYSWGVRVGTKAAVTKHLQPALERLNCTNPSLWKTWTAGKE